MATYEAISAVGAAVIRLLRTSYSPALFNNNQLEFQVYLASDFAKPMTSGVSLFLYRVFRDGTSRTPGGRLAPNGLRQRPQLPVDLHFLLSAWGKDPSLQLTVAGWMMRVMEDVPILPTALLNAVAPGVFEPDETVEISLGEMRTEDLFQMWEVLGPGSVYQLSIPYVARNVRIESTLTVEEYAPVQERTFDYAQI